jgi:succinyl-CoA synthetase beta subunit
MLVALERTAISAPIVVRFDGTNAAEGRAILTDSGRPNIFIEPTMLDAARHAVELAA